MEADRTLKETAMEKFTKLGQTEKALVLGILLGIESAKAQEKKAI